MRGELILSRFSTTIRLQLNKEVKPVCLGEVGANPTLTRNREKVYFQVGLPTTFIYPPVEDCGARILI
jgi:hypothetical protein